MLTGFLEIPALQEITDSPHIGEQRGAEDAGWGGSGLFFFRFDGNGLQILGFEDLPAIETFDVVHAITAGNDHCFLMFAGGLHRNAWKRYELF